MSDPNHDPIVTELPAALGYQAQQLSGRQKVSIWKKINPWWWMLNDHEPEAPAWYHPEWPNWFRTFMFNGIRNFFSNFSAYVVGVKDRNYVIRGTYPVDSGTLADIGLYGWKWSIIELGRLRLPFVGYSSKYLIGYAGWAWEGNLGFKFVPRIGLLFKDLWAKIFG